MSLTDELFETAKPIWDAQLQHPFVTGLANGSLEIERFSRWVLQDYLYLKEFARVFAWAAAKSDSLAAMSWYAKVLDLTLNTEMALHRAYAERFGISAARLEEETMWPTTRAYTDFLVRTAADGDMPDLLATLLPCAWGYVYVARRLAQGAAPPDERYAEWIDQYASDEFADAADWLKAELNRTAAVVTPTKKQRLTELFLTSSRYEWQFWEMCWTGEEWGV
ncbi:MAG: thiaminase II [Gemmatimonadota bacterium]|nr:MAG: thiaminase II [Gemmatimonadota bacterium]